MAKTMTQSKKVLTAPTPYRVRQVQDEAQWECYRRVPAHGFHAAETRRSGIDEVYSVADCRVDAINEAKRLNSQDVGKKERRI